MNDKLKDALKNKTKSKRTTKKVAPKTRINAKTKQDFDLLISAYIKDLKELIASSSLLNFLNERFENAEINDPLKLLGYFRICARTLKEDLLKKEEELNILKAKKENLFKKSEVEIKNELRIKEEVMPKHTYTEDEKDKIISNLKEEIKNLQNNFINFRNRNENILQESINRANEQLILKILPVIDNLERALNAGSDCEINTFIKGIKLIQEQFDVITHKEGLEKIKSQGELFNPVYHEVLMEIETKEFSPDTIVEEVRKGYIYKSKVVRPALVKVAKVNL